MQTHVTEAAVYMDNVQRHATRKPKERKKKKEINKERKKERKKGKKRKTTYNHTMSSVCGLMMIYIDGECHENVLKGFQIIQ